MAVTTRGSGADTTDVTAVNASAFTPTANSLLLAFVAGWGNSMVSTGIGVNGGSLTWTLIDGDDIDLEFEPVGYRLFRAQVGGSPGSMTIQGTTSVCDELHVQVIEVTGHDSASPIGATGKAEAQDGGATTPSVTLSATPASDSQLVGFTALLAGGNPEAGSGWTENHDIVFDEMTSHSQNRTGTTSTSVAWGGTAASDGWLAVAVEVLAAGGAPAAVRATGRGLTASILLNPRSLVS